MAGEGSLILNPKALVIPKITETVRDTLAPEKGTIIYNTTSNKLNMAIASTVGSAAWEAVTSTVVVT